MNILGIFEIKKLRSEFLDFWSPEVAQRGVEGADEEGRPAEPDHGAGEAPADGPGVSEEGAAAGV